MRYLKYILVFCLLPGWVAVRGQDVPPDELYSADRPLDEVVVEGKLMRPDDIKQILGGFFNASDFSDALQAYRVKNDQDLTTLFADFEKATTVKIVPRSYIDFSSFWFDRVREWAEEDYAEAVLGQTRFISDEIIFLPLADGSYEVQLRLTPSLLLEQEGGIGRPMLDARAEAVRLRYWHGTTFGSPKEARPSIATGHGELLGQLKGEIADAGLPAIDPDKEEYYRRMGTIIQSPEQPFREQLNVMWEAYKFFSLCVDQGWESHRENGVVPYCFWKDQSDPRVPFLAGVVDAAYIDTEAMSHLPELIEQIRESALELGYAYIVGSFKCPEGELIQSKEEYREIVTRMALSEPSFGAWKWLEEMVTTTDKERIDELESFFNGCEKVEAYRQKLAEVTDFMQDWKAMLNAYLEIEGRVTAYLEVLKAGDDESWYERGLLTSQAALAVLPVGNFSKTKKARQVVELLKDESNWVRVTEEGLKNASPLLANLSAGLRKTYNELISIGLKPEFRANSILLKNDKGETVALLANDNLTPIKWRPHYESKIVLESEQGYWALKEGDDIYFDLGFLDGRKVRAEQANDYLVNSGRAQKEGQPYLSGTIVEELTLNEGDIIYFVENYNGGIRSPGGFGSNEITLTITDLRSRLAVLEEWKQLGDIPTLRSYKVIKPLRVRSGTIGPQLEKTGANAGTTYPGGGHQYEVIENLRGRNWEAFLEPAYEEVLK